MNAPRILVVRGGAIGDFILTLPAIGALRERWPGARIEILGYPHIVELAHGRGYADAVRSIEAKAMAGFFVPEGELDEALAEYFGSFQLVLSYLFDPDHVFAGNVRRCGVKHLVEASPRPVDCHAAEHYCKPLESLAIYVERPVPRVYPSATDCEAAKHILGVAKFVALHPGSGSERKNWPVEKFGAVARWLVDEMAAELVVVEGAADGAVVKQLVELVAPRPVRVARGVRLPELAAVLEKCVLFVGNDSGITHLAAAVGRPTVAMFGPVSLGIWEPRSWRWNVRVVRFGEGDIARTRGAIEELWQGEVVDSQGHLA